MPIIIRSEELGVRSFGAQSAEFIDKVIVTRSLAVLPLAGGRGTIACDGGRSYHPCLRQQIGRGTKSSAFGGG